MSLVFDATAHEYRVKGVRLPGVTEIIGAALGNAFAGVPAGTLEYARQRGTAWHKARELDDAGQLDEASVAPEIAGMLEAWREFRRAWPHKVVCSELPMYNPALGYCGTPDVVLETHGWCAVVDGKTGLPGMRAALQTAAYAELVRHHFNATKTPRRFSIQVQASGKFKVIEYDKPADWRDFLACLAVYRMKQREAA